MVAAVEHHGKREWMVHGPDLDTGYGEFQGLGGLETVVDEASAGRGTPIIDTIHGHVVATIDLGDPTSAADDTVIGLFKVIQLNLRLSMNKENWTQINRAESQLTLTPSWARDILRMPFDEMLTLPNLEEAADGKYILSDLCVLSFLVFQS